MFSLWRVVAISAFSLYITVSATTICSEENRTKDLESCLTQIRKDVRDNTLFWFGTNYSSRCPGSHNVLECTNPRANMYDSLQSRLLGDTGDHSPHTIDRFLSVQYVSQKGQYNSCGYIWTSSNDTSFQVDPLEADPHTPWDTRHLPNMSWTAPSSDEHFTVVIFNAGFLINNGIFINIPGNNFLDGEVAKPYQSPDQIFSFENIYTFILFKQTGAITLSDEWKGKLSITHIHGVYTIPEMMEALQLIGPVAMNWIRVVSDPYAIQLHIDHEDIYACPILMEKEIKKHNRLFIPETTKISVDVEITFSPPAIAFTSCCSAYYYDSKVLKLNPIGNSSVSCGDVRTGVNPKLTLTRMGMMSQRKEFNGTLYTLICVDPDVPTASFGTPEHPFLQWQVANIRHGDLSTGDVVMTYAGPAPLNNQGHTYYFLLYEQDGEVNVTSYENFTNPVGARSLFNISGFVDQMRLRLVGVTYMIAKSDEYTRYEYVELKGRASEDYCMGIEGFSDPCPTSRAHLIQAYLWALMPSVMLLLTN